MAQASKLQNALIAALGSETYTFGTKKGGEVEVNIKDIPDESLVAIFRYGDRYANDSVNSAVHNGKDAQVALEEWIGRLKDGTLGQRGGGGQGIDQVTKEARELAAHFAANNVKDLTLSDKRKDGQKVQDGARSMVRDQGWETLTRKVAQGLGIDADQKVAEIQTKAEERAAQAGGSEEGPKIDLDALNS